MNGYGHLLRRYMSDEGEEDAEEEAEQEEAPAIEESAVVEEGQALHQFFLSYFLVIFSNF